MLYSVSQIRVRAVYTVYASTCSRTGLLFITEHWWNGKAGAGMERDWLYQDTHVKLFSVCEPNYFVYENKFCYLEKRKKIIEHRDCNDEHPMQNCSINLHKSGQAVDNRTA
jgi:hypothetical protein